MSINQFSSELLPETIWWAQQQLMKPSPTTTTTTTSTISPHHHHPSWLHSAMFPPQNPSHHNFNLNEEDDIDQEIDQEPSPPQQQGYIFNNQETLPDILKEPMFEKPLTPSDVGKLNRLVIPKQHAEKYFPLNGGGGGGGGGESAGVDRGLLLSFEDESGKCWRFRYSYWNSSQSYVLTKGWSRYVKEKQLDAGDVVLFERHRRDMERLFIGWRRRGQDQSNSGTSSSVVPGVQGSIGGVWNRGLYPPSSSSSPSGHHHLPYQPDCLHAGWSGGQGQTTTQIGNPKRLRLFGVNMECQQVDESEPSTPDDGSSLSSSQGPGPGPAHHQFYYYSSSSTSHDHNIIRHN